MPLKKIMFRPGVNRENTRYASEALGSVNAGTEVVGGWYDSEKVRFRAGTPEKIGGWVQISANYFKGVCRSLWNWVTLNSQNLIGVGTNLKFYIANGGAYYDITPVRATTTLTNPFSTTLNSSTVLVTDAAGGYINGDYVTFNGSSAIGGLTLLGEYKISLQSATTYNITAESTVDLTLSTGTFTAQFKLANNVQVVLSTTGALPNGFVAGTTYYVVNTSGFTFQLAASSGGTAIVPTGTQSGVHTATAKATSTTASGGGTVYAMYQINTGPEYTVALTGWGAGGWGLGAWGIGATGTDAMRLWSQSNFGEDLVFGPRGGAMYYWNASYNVTGAPVTITIASPAVLTASVNFVNGDAIMLTTTGALPTGLTPGTVYYVINASGTTCNLAATAGGSAINTSGTQSGTHTIATRGIPVTKLASASDVPTIQNLIFVSDISRFAFAFGCNDYGSTVQDPMLIRWSDQESVVNWTPSATNQAGSLRLSHGSQIITCLQTRQEIVVLTDSSVYSLQYLGAPTGWGSQLLGDNISIMGQNAAVLASGVVYWMGTDKFYKYDGRVQTLRCDLRQYIYSDINLAQAQQVYSGTNEGFNEVWWFYCSANSNQIDKYVVYNYLEDVWYYGTMARTAWLDSGTLNYPIATPYISSTQNNIVYHENGNDDNTTGTPAAIDSYISSSEFDISDGHNFGFIWRILPDLTFRGSTGTETPQLTMTLIPLQNSGSGYTNPPSVGGSDYANINRITTTPVEEFTGQVYVRVRGRQLVFKVEGNQLGLQWQLGAPRIDIRADGRRGNS
jgi:hypothetical protein